MRSGTIKLIDGLKRNRMAVLRTFFGTRKGLAEHYRAQRANGLNTSIHEAQGKKSKSRYAKQLRKFIKNPV